jgi:hypothetical protein
MMRAERIASGDGGGANGDQRRTDDGSTPIAAAVFVARCLSGKKNT